MTIEIADRLVKLRKQKGLSQEELADKLGLSRQAVSKWERAEASPDTDNLICLAKLYGVSLDELLNTDEDIDTIVKEQVKSEESETETIDPEQTVVDDEPKAEEKKSKKIEINDGIHLCDDEGNEIHIQNNRIELKNKDGETKILDKNHKKKEPKIVTISNVLEGVLFLCAATVFFLFSSLNVGPFTWANSWIFILIPEIICSVLRAIGHKRLCDFNIVFVSTFIFFLVCMVFDSTLWHPMWVVFLAIPIYYTACAPIDKYIHRNDVEKKFCDCACNKE